MGEKWRTFPPSKLCEHRRRGAMSGGSGGLAAGTTPPPPPTLQEMPSVAIPEKYKSNDSCMHILARSVWQHYHI